MDTPRRPSLRRHMSVLRLMAVGALSLAGEWSQGSMQGILMNLEMGTMTAGADPRRTQYAVGW